MFWGLFVRQPIFYIGEIKNNLRVAEKMFCSELRRIWARFQGVENFAYQDLLDFPQWISF
jgi:hypothetical protein